MKTLIAATALAVAAAGFTLASAPPAQAQSVSKEQAAKQKVKKAKPAKRVVRHRSPYSTNPAHDAYVNGVYVGSDPDPRIRWSLRREYCQDAVDGCMDAQFRGFR